MTTWVKETAQDASWVPEHLGTILRITEDSHYRITEDGDFRIIELDTHTNWTKETTPPATWS